MKKEEHEQNIKARMELLDTLRPEDRREIREYRKALDKLRGTKDRKNYLFSTFLTILMILRDMEKDLDIVIGLEREAYEDEKKMKIQRDEMQDMLDDTIRMCYKSHEDWEKALDIHRKAQAKIDKLRSK